GDSDMNRVKRMRISPAIVVAVLALVMGVTGAAVAGPSAKGVSKGKAKKIADKQIDKREAGLSVASAVALDTIDYQRSGPLDVADGTTATLHADCPSGEFVTGGGGIVPAANGIEFQRSFPSNGNPNETGYTSWTFNFRNNSGTTRNNVRAYAVCTKALNN